MPKTNLRHLSWNNWTDAGEDAGEDDGEDDGVSCILKNTYPIFTKDFDLLSDRAGYYEI